MEAAKRQGLVFLEGDVLVVSQKVVSKAEGRIVDLANVKPTKEAQDIAKLTGKDPRLVQVVLQESRSLLRVSGPHIITETFHGFVCANAGIDKSNVEGEAIYTLLPEDPDHSAEALRNLIKERSGKDVAVIICDTFGRPWRLGQVNFAIGVSGLSPLKDYRGHPDMFQRRLAGTIVAIADELASAAELVMNKVDGIPAALIRGYEYCPGEGRISHLIRPAEEDLFR